MFNKADFMLKSYKFILLSTLSFSSICYSMEDNKDCNQLLCNKNQKQISNDNRAKSLNNYPEKQMFFKNNIINNKCNNNELTDNNKDTDVAWQFIINLTSENNNLKDNINTLIEENNNLKIQNKKVQQKIEELTKLINTLQKQIESNNISNNLLQDNTQNNDCENNSVMTNMSDTYYSQYISLRNFNDSLIQSINKMEEKVVALEAINIKKESKIMSLKRQNSKLSLKLNHNISKSINTNNIYNEFNKLSYKNNSLYSNYKYYNNTGYNNVFKNNNQYKSLNINNKNYKRPYSVQKGSETDNQLLTSQIENLKQERNNNVTQNKNNELNNQKNESQNNNIKSEIESKQILVNNSLENNNKKEKVENNKENSPIQQSINDIVGLDLNKVAQKAKKRAKKKAKKNARKEEKQQKENYTNNITTVQTNNNKIQINESNISNNIESLKQNKDEIITQNNSINNIEDKKEDHNKNEIILESNNINNIKNENIDNRQIIDQYSIENDHEIPVNIHSIPNNISSNNFNLKNNNNCEVNKLAVIIEQTEADEINKNKIKKLRNKENKQKKDKEFYDLFKEFDNQSKDEQNNNDDKVSNNPIIEKLKIMQEQIIKESYNYNYSIDQVKNTTHNYFTVLQNNNGILRSLLFKKRTKNSNLVYCSYIISRIIEIKTYNDTLHKDEKAKNMQLLKFNLQDSILNNNKHYNKFMIKTLYFNVFKNKLFVNGSISFDSNIKSALTNANNFLIKLFKPLTMHNEKVTEILNDWEKKICNEKTLINLTDEDKRNLLIEKYAKYFLNKIKMQYNQQSILRVNTEDTQKIIDIFTRQIIRIINIIQKNEFNDYKQLIHLLSKEIEEKLISEYSLFLKMNYSSYQYNEEVSEEILKKFIKGVNDTKNTSEVGRAVYLRSIILSNLKYAI